MNEFLAHELPAVVKTWASEPRGRRPTALFAQSLIVIPPLIAELARYGLRVPHELSIITVSCDMVGVLVVRDRARLRPDSRLTSVCGFIRAGAAGVRCRRSHRPLRRISRRQTPPRPRQPAGRTIHSAAAEAALSGLRRSGLKSQRDVRAKH